MHATSCRPIPLIEPHPLQFFLFIALNAVLFLRPQELIPGLESAPLYLGTIIACILTTGVAMLKQMSPEVLYERPINVCVLGLLVAVPLSHLAQLSGESIWYARESFSEFWKVVLLFFLASAVLDSEQKIEKFFNWLLLLITLVAGLSLGHHLGYFNIPALEALDRRVVMESGELEMVAQLRGTGIFNDPNDLAMILVLGFVLSIHVLTDPDRGVFRFSALPLLGLLLLGLFMTKSRGGILAFGAAAGVLAYARWGKLRAILAGIAASPLVLLVFKMRGDESMGEGTGQHRVQLWAEGFSLLKSSPLFGIGYGRYAEEMGLVAHNSFVHTFTELGIFGGTCFFGVFFSALIACYQLRKLGAEDDELKATQRRIATITAAICGIGFSMLTLSRAYVAPTYLVMGLVAATIACESRRLEYEGWSLPRLPCADQAWAQKQVIASIGFLVATYVFIRLTARWG